MLCIKKNLNLIFEGLFISDGTVLIRNELLTTREIVKESCKIPIVISILRFCNDCNHYTIA